MFRYQNSLHILIPLINNTGFVKARNTLIGWHVYVWFWLTIDIYQVMSVTFFTVKKCRSRVFARTRVVFTTILLKNLESAMPNNNLKIF